MGSSSSKVTIHEDIRKIQTDVAVIRSQHNIFEDHTAKDLEALFVSKAEKDKLWIFVYVLIALVILLSLAIAGQRIWVQRRLKKNKDDIQEAKINPNSVTIYI